MEKRTYAVADPIGCKNMTMVEMGKVSAKGGVMLFLSLVISTVASAAGMILLARLLSPPAYGLLAISFILPNTVALFRDWGMGWAVTRFVAQSRSSTGMLARTWSYARSGFSFVLIMGLALAALNFALSGFFANQLVYRPEVEVLVRIASLIVLAGGLTSVSQAVLIGLEEMRLSSGLTILQSCLTSTLPVLLVSMGSGVTGAAIGYSVAAIVVAGLSSWIALRRLFFLRGRPQKKPDNTQTMRTMLRFGTPLSVAGIAIGLAVQFLIYLVAVSVSNHDMGNYQVAVNASVIITFLSAPISTVLLPAFSKMSNAAGDLDSRVAFRFSVKLASLLVLPPSFAVASIAGPFVRLLFGSDYSGASAYLILLAAGSLATAFGGLSISNFMKAKGDTILLLKYSLIGTAVGIGVGVLLIPALHVSGLIIASLLLNVPLIGLGLIHLKRIGGVDIDWSSSLRITASSGTAAMLAFLSAYPFSNSPLIQLSVGLVIFLVVVVFTLLLLGAVTEDDIILVARITDDVGLLTGPTSMFLRMMNRLCRLLNPKTESHSRMEARE